MEYLDLRHDGLGRYRRVWGGAAGKTLQSLWQKQWQRRQQAENAIGGGAKALRTLRAEEQSEEASAQLVGMTAILLDAVRKTGGIDWNACLDAKPFLEPPPQAPAKLDFAREPQGTDMRFLPPKHSFMVRMFRPKKVAAELETAQGVYRAAHEEWKMTVQWHAKEHAAGQVRYEAALADWDGRKSAFYARQARANDRIASLRSRYGEKDVAAIAAACDLSLLDAPRPEGFPAFWRIAFGPDRTVTVQYDLPAPESLPALKAVKYLPDQGRYQGVMLSEAERAALYEEAMYQTCLMVVHRIFAADPGDCIRAVAFNGWVNHIDRRMGCPSRLCLMALSVGRDAFTAHDLTSVDPKSCFRTLGGVAGARLMDLEGVAPIPRPR